jgi:two-component system chemotaxis response regulator CheB
MLSMLPADFPVSILIVQHMPRLFTGALAERLDRCCALKVREAYEGAVPAPGTVWIAQGDTHMEVRSTLLPDITRRRRGEGRIHLHEARPVNYCRPSADLLFQSAAAVYGSGTLALVMTGMGSDGTAGAMRVHQNGGIVWAQDQASSAVWGMPGRVMQTGIVDALIPLMSLSEALTLQTWVGRGKRESPDMQRSLVDGMVRGVEVADGVL